MPEQKSFISSLFMYIHYHAENCIFVKSTLKQFQQMVIENAICRYRFLFLQYWHVSMAA